MPRLRIDSSFEKAYGKLSTQDQRATDRALLNFIENPRRPSLHLERIKGDYWSIRASRRIRIMLRSESREDGEIWAVVDVGTHQVYRRY